MLRQYGEIKAKYPNEILFFRLGDFYEMFGDDALIASKILNITLTARHKGTAHETPMCGVPFHAVDNYIYKLTKAGKRVAICEQLSDPTLPGIVKRDVIRIITPGTTLDNNVLENKSNNYLASLFLFKETWGLALADLTTGEFAAAQIDNFEYLKNELKRLKPTEVIVPAVLFNDSRYQNFINSLPNVNIFQLPAYEKAERFLINHFKVKSLASFGFENLPVAIEAAGGLLGYLKETQKTTLDHLTKITRYAFENFMVLDHSTIRNLEIFQNAVTGQASGSLIDVIDKTTTALGGRRLRQWLLFPLINKKQIEERHAAVAEFINQPQIQTELIENLKKIADLERLLGRIGCQRATPRDFIALKNSLSFVAPIKDLLKQCQNKLLKDFGEKLPDNQAVINLIDRTLKEEVPVSVNEGGFIKPGYNQQLDELRAVAAGGKEWLAKYQAAEIERTKINSLKVKFNKIFGYYIEVSKANLDAVPDNYIRKQTLVNSERFITQELREFENKILGAEDKINQLEFQIFTELRESTVKYFPDIQKTAEIISYLDVLVGFALLAKENNYCCPQITDDGILEIKDGRHPVIEKFTEHYVPNDLQLNHDDCEFILLTGPNMSGKSSFLRQTAINVLLAQIGSFIPAAEAKIGIVDRIFTRVGASDNLAQGVSTFMNEMQEAANILNNATRNSLIILDELGRGTSTYDGVSIAWAIIEFIHEKIQAKTLFATHYHELVEVIKKLPRAQNYCVAVSENAGQVVFLHKIVKGATSRSYGIEVARLAGLPDFLIARAREILMMLEDKSQIKTVSKPQQKAFDLPTREEKLTKVLANIDINNLTPLDALQTLAQLKKTIRRS